MAKHKDWYATYRRSESGKKAIKRYESSDAARERKRRYRASKLGQETQRAQRERKRLRARQITQSAKQVPCADCGGTFDPVCMDFHHVRGTKDFNIGWGRYGLERLKREIEKCIVLCANCHRMRHKL
jgi:hypothetical protein